MGTTWVKRTCTFCGVKKAEIKGRGEACFDCEREMVAADKLFQARPRATHRKCRDCKAPLPASRYFQCENCVPEATREAADAAWDMVECLGGQESQVPHSKVGNKRCRGCGTRKDLKEFGRHGGYADGLQATCRACLSAARRARKEEGGKDASLSV